jgi:ribulose 1,5-bisphosphate synthetase/thiazole synthase
MENLGGARKLDLKQMTAGLQRQALPFKKGHEYDIIIIGGGTGGLSCA